MIVCLLIFTFPSFNQNVGKTTRAVKAVCSGNVSRKLASVAPARPRRWRLLEPAQQLVTPGEDFPDGFAYVQYKQSYSATVRTKWARVNANCGSLPTTAVQMTETSIRKPADTTLSAGLIYPRSRIKNGYNSFLISFTWLITMCLGNLLTQPETSPAHLKANSTWNPV